MRYEDGAINEKVDDWTSAQDHDAPAELWAGVTTCTVGLDKSMVQTTDYQIPDYWLTEAHIWIRVRVAPRRALFTPHGTNHGPTYPE